MELRSDRYNEALGAIDRIAMDMGLEPEAVLEDMLDNWRERYPQSADLVQPSTGISEILLSSVRKQPDGPRKVVFLKRAAEGGGIMPAVGAAQISPHTYYKWQRQDSVFAQALEAVGLRPRRSEH